jgi:hypothetical protein
MGEADDGIGHHRVDHLGRASSAVVSNRSGPPVLHPAHGVDKFGLGFVTPSAKPPP